MTQSTIVIPTSPAWVQWRSVESIVYSSRLLYGRFAASPIGAGEAISLGAHLRSLLIGKIQGTCITSAKITGASHEYSTLIGVRESVDQILLNLRGIVLRGKVQNEEKGYLKVLGPGRVTAAHLRLPSWIQTVDPNQHITVLEEPVQLNLELTIETGIGSHRYSSPRYDLGTFETRAVFSPIRRVNCTVHSLGDAPQSAELLFLEIETNGALTPIEARDEAFQLLLIQVLSALGAKASQELCQNAIGSMVISIDQLGISSKVYNCLKRANIHTLPDLLCYTREQLLDIRGLGERAVEEVTSALHREGFFLPIAQSNRNI